MAKVPVSPGPTQLLCKKLEDTRRRVSRLSAASEAAIIGITDEDRNGNSRENGC